MNQPQILRCPHCEGNYTNTQLANYTNGNSTECPDCTWSTPNDQWIDADPDFSEWSQKQ